MYSIFKYSAIDSVVSLISFIRDLIKGSDKSSSFSFNKESSCEVPLKNLEIFSTTKLIFSLKILS